MQGLAHARVTTRDGIAMHIVRGPRQSGVPVVLLPAFADSWWSWSRVHPALAERHDVVAIDLRGHGDSDRPECCYRVEDVAGDVLEVLDNLGIGRAILVGHSSSCFAARHIAATHPDRVAGLALIGSPLALDRRELQPIVDAVLGLEDPVDPEFIREFELGASHQPLPDAFAAGLLKESAKLPARVWRATLEGLLDFRDEEALGRIVAPTTLIRGDRDPIISRDEQEQLLRRIAGAELVVVPDTGHSPHWERPHVMIDVLLKAAARGE